MKTINGPLWKAALISASNAMANHAERINALNVFPVPDGDTGSNMHATIAYATQEIIALPAGNIAEIASAFSRGMLLGARGNSGVILSQIFKGFSVAFANRPTVHAFDVVSAFESAREYAYKSVMKPVEGTILTVIRETAAKLAATITPNNSIEEVFAMAVDFAQQSCASTPELLPILKEVGVTDSGGEGLSVILDGIYQAIMGRPIELLALNDQQIEPKTFIMKDEVWDGEFGYCTEFIVDLKLPRFFDKTKFEKSLQRMGNSLVVVRDENILKAHIHTLKPGQVFTFAQRFGEFIRIKSENMTLQANESHGRRTSTATVSEESKVQKKLKIGVISCNTGQGIIDEMKGLGTNFVIEAGQTMNPSAKDFITAIESLNAENIFILPNNSNIILVAQQVAQTSDQKVIVIPTKTQVQGIAVMQNFDHEASVAENKRAMNEAIESVLTGQVTTSSRTTKIDGVQVRQDEFLSIAEKNIIGSNKSKVQAAIAIVDKLMSNDIELVTIFFGEDATEVDATDVASYIESNFDVDIELKNGGQPLYHFFLGFHKEVVWE